MAERRDPDGDVVLRKRTRARVAVVPQVVHQHVDLAARRVVEEVLVELQGVLEAPRHLRYQVGLQRRMDEPHGAGLERLELPGEWGGQQRERARETGHGHPKAAGARRGAEWMRCHGLRGGTYTVTPAPVRGSRDHRSEDHADPAGCTRRVRSAPYALRLEHE